MLTRRDVIRSTAVGAMVAGVSAIPLAKPGRAEDFEVTKSEEEWRRLLPKHTFYVMREEGTEPPGTSELLFESRPGIYQCAGCDLGLFSSETKYDPGEGWPSFWEALPDAVRNKRDESLGMVRTEEHCRRCGGHLGHVFNDGPEPTGKRHCINGVALRFVKRKA